VQKISGLPTFQVTLISGIPWLAAIPAMLLSAWHSDKTGERRWHAAIPILLVGAALALSIWAGNRLTLAISAFSLATMALYAFPPPFWALPSMFLTGTAAAASIALVNSAGNLGGFVGPYVIGFLTDKTGNYVAGISYLIASGFVGGILVLLLRAQRPAHGP
jgi:ACS family tartrate transporter-like MFS transporter